MVKHSPETMLSIQGWELHSRAKPRPTLGLELQAKGSDHIIKVLGDWQAYIASSGPI